ncbi:MAG TPA: diaminopimelate decarboxylase [Methanotrichaceae archaeon]|nr:diaminopimelate decarboxylase [Methanotrichaceae archaeon]
MFGTKAHLRAINDHLFIEDVDSAGLAREYGTPLYVTSETRLRENIRAYHRAFPEADKYFAVKANGNLAILRILAQEGMGADVFSGGELYVARLAGIPKDKILYNGNSKSEADHRMALEAGVRMSVDSKEEMGFLAKTAQAGGKEAEILFRVNPDVSPKTHPKIATGLKTSKFGIPAEQVAETYKKAMDLAEVLPVGLHCHIGSQILDTSPFAEAAGKMMDIAQDVLEKGGEIKMIDLGGGLGIQYHPDNPAPTPDDLAEAVLPIFNDRCQDLGIKPKLILEPGRSIVADTTIMLTGVNVVKRAHVNFVAVDAGFNVLARPMLYDSYHHVIVATKAGQKAHEAQETYTVVGPICETGDVLAKDRKLPALERGDVLAFLDAGAYGFSMASQYNGQPRPAEVLVSRCDAELTRKAEDYSALLAGQRVPPRLMW